MAHWPGDSEYELRRARSNVSISCAHICRLRWPWVSGRPSRGFHKNPALNANHARQTQRRLLGRSLTFPARTASTMRRSLCAYEAAYGDSRLDGAAGGHEANAVDGYGAPRTSCRLTRISNVVRCVNVRKGGSGIRAYAFLSSSTVGDGLGSALAGFSSSAVPTASSLNHFRKVTSSVSIVARRTMATAAEPPIEMEVSGPVGIRS